VKALAALDEDEAVGGRPVLLRDDTCHNRPIPAPPRAKFTKQRGDDLCFEVSGGPIWLGP
jgi:hypothetical protein